MTLQQLQDYQAETFPPIWMASIFTRLIIQNFDEFWFQYVKDLSLKHRKELYQKVRQMI